MPEPSPFGRGRQERAAPELDGGLDAAGLCRADARQARELVAMETRDAVRTAGQREHAIGNRQGVGAGRAMPEHYGNELVVAERVHAAADELLARPIRRRQLAESAFEPIGAVILSGRMHRRSLPAVILLAAVMAACSEPPTEEREQAQGAIAAARAAGADTYAAEELRAAESSLAEYETAVAAGDYRAALSAAIDARESAYAAARRAGDEKASARSEAEQLLAAVTAETAEIERRLGGGAPRPSPATAARLRASLKTANAALQEARSLATKQDYRAAIDVLRPVREALAADAPPDGPPRRGR